MAYLEELFPEFRKGAKIRRKCWVCGIDGVCKDENYSFHAHDVNADDWEVVPDKPIDWQYIIDHKCLCWFWDEEDLKCLGLLIRFPEKKDQFQYKTNIHKGVKYFKYCCPVHRDEVTFYEDKKDE